MQQEIIPAIGCTEPVAVSLCVAKATQVLGVEPEQIGVILSPNVLKNAMGVGIPGTGMIGLPIAVALGALIGKPEYGLEVLRDLQPADVERARQYVQEQRIKIDVDTEIEEKLYIEVRCFSGNDSSIAVIRGSHTRFSYIGKNGEELLRNDTKGAEEKVEEVPLTFRKVYEFAADSPIDELEFILEAAKMNREASLQSQKQKYGHDVAKSLMGERGRAIFGENIHSRMISATAGACDARMDGALIPVMSNSGSGNQGVAATLPVLTYAEDVGSDRESLIRALILSNLTVIHIKQYLGRLSQYTFACGIGRIQLRHNLSDGRQLRSDYLCRQEHDRQYHRHDLRRCKTELCTEDCQRHLHRNAFRIDGHRESGGDTA